MLKCIVFSAKGGKFAARFISRLGGFRKAEIARFWGCDAGAVAAGLPADQTRGMADSSPTVGELFKAEVVTDEQVIAPAEAYLAVPGTTAHPIADGYTFDL